MKSIKKKYLLGCIQHCRSTSSQYILAKNEIDEMTHQKMTRYGIGEFFCAEIHAKVTSRVTIKCSEKYVTYLGAITAKNIEVMPTNIEVLSPYIIALNIVEQSATLAHQHQQSPTGVVILFVHFQMLGQIGNPMGKQTDLDFRRTRIGVMLFVFFDEFFFSFRCVRQCFVLLKMVTD